MQLHKRLLRSYPRDTKAILEVVTASVLVIVPDNNNPCGFLGYIFTYHTLAKAFGLLF